jgi:hypothetical protein
MGRLAILYRLARALASLWAWRPPRGVALFVRVDVRGGWCVAMVSDGEGYVTAYWPWTAMTRAMIHRRLDEAVLMLADERRLTGAGPGPDEPPAPSWPTLAQAAATFDHAMERRRRELRRERNIIPIRERKGGA